MTTAPSLFVSHGSPMFALEPGLLGPALQRIGRALPDLAAVVIVSPHWQTQGVRVATTSAPETIHDFGGFPPPLYALQYTPPGAPTLAVDVVRMLADAGFAASIDAHRGLDHGAWVPMRYLKPDADVPVFQVSLPHDLDTAGALRLGQALAPLRAPGVLVVGSGRHTHNH
jgi:4,5-DOPA dioxygenase extradiol